MKPTKLLTLSFIHNDKEILLALKKRGFGIARYNGYGGKVQSEESIEQAAIRETKEEITLDVKKLEKRGIIRFDSEKFDKIQEVHIFKIMEYEGTPTETDEMKPRWFKKTEIPYSNMWPDDEFWLPIFLQEKKFKGEFEFDENDKVISHKLEEVEEL